MATYNQIFDMEFRNQVFREQVYVAIKKAASDTQNEDPSTVHHIERLKWANDAFSDVKAAREKMMPFICMNVTLQGEAAAGSVPDGDIQFTVNSLVNQMAGFGAGS